MKLIITASVIGAFIGSAAFAANSSSAVDLSIEAGSQSVHVQCGMEGSSCDSNYDCCYSLMCVRHWEGIELIGADCQ